MADSETCCGFGGLFSVKFPELSSAILDDKLVHAAPLVVCFNGLTGFRWYMQYAEGERVTPQLGLQPQRIGQSRVFVAPNPSPANAAYSLETIAGWYRKLGELRGELKRG